MDQKTQKSSYYIRFEGHLPESWSEWFDGFEIVREPEGITRISGEITDQPALHSLIERLRDLGLLIVEVKRFEPCLGVSS